MGKKSVKSVCAGGGKEEGIGARQAGKGRHRAGPRRQTTLDRYDGILSVHSSLVGAPGFSMGHESTRV